ncbi:DsbA family protein [Actinomyces howellii]|uniref:Thiol-disulfide oxidoreductase D n=1 Tax=Actinomyces howellii TaxID=52771 RepID=A0A448HHL9_9ACTO|nr:thioredoxin domain-containing protein [Actinomyces howellii]VEG28654.1 Thiol-disulfide oxidoreductase D [Actinomyces howellii]
MSVDSPAPVRQGNPLVVALLVVIAILLAVIAGILVTRDDRSAPAQTAATVSTDPSAAAATDPGAAASAAPTDPATSEPSQTDPAVLEILHAEVSRDPEDPRAQGAVDAPVVMVLYSDFSCPYCTQLAQEVEPELADLVEAGTLRIEWRDLAQVSATSPLAAQAGIAAANQGMFWEFHDAVYAAADPTGHPEYTEESLIELARAAGVPDIEQFTADMNDPATVQAVTEATQHAQQIGIDGTPFMIINDAYIPGYQPAEYVRATIEEQAAAAQ